MSSTQLTFIWNLETFKKPENLDRLSQVSSKLLNNRIRALSDIMIAVNQSLIGNKINLEKLLYSVDFFKESETLCTFIIALLDLSENKVTLRLQRKSLN